MTHALTFHTLTDRPEFLDVVADRIWTAWWSQSGVSPAELRKDVALSIGAQSTPDAIIALKNGIYAGSALLIANDDADFPHLTPWIAAVWVEPEHRRQGIAGQIMAQLRTRARAAGIEAVYLVAKAQRIPFYLGQGYQLISTTPDGSGIFSYPLRHDLRAERDGDAAAISALTTLAFEAAPHSSGTEAHIVERLRAAGALQLSLVIENEGEIVAHAAFSPVRIDGMDLGWVGLGPVSVAPAHQGRGLGAALIRQGLDWMRTKDAKGCVVLGDPAYYARFGFAPRQGLTLEGVPPEYFQALPFGETTPEGVVSYSEAFGA